MKKVNSLHGHAKKIDSVGLKTAVGVALSNNLYFQNYDFCEYGKFGATVGLINNR